jgi:Protein of unknown function DUF262
MKFEITELRSGTVWNLYRMRDRIQVDPEYQRLSEIWTLDKRELLIDTILNDLDVPKIYLHKFNEPLKKGAKSYDYAIIDGKQRFETICAFIEGKIALANDFKYFNDPAIQASSMNYGELGKQYPDLKVQFDSFQLTVICVETDDLEMIEEMFSRLNEAATLTAPEKRNAYGGPLPRAIRKLASESLFTAKIPFPNKRYRHFDLATKFLLAESAGKVVDTKKTYLDKFVEAFAGQSRTKMPEFLKHSQDNVSRMASVFTSKDALLRQVGIVTLYYHLFRIGHKAGWEHEITRKRLADFEKLRAANRELAEKDSKKANYELIEFDRYAQSPNDAYAMRFRLGILLHDVFKKDVATDDL